MSESPSCSLRAVCSGLQYFFNCSSKPPSWTDPALNPGKQDWALWPSPFRISKVKVAVHREAMEQSGREHICVCTSWGGPGLGMGNVVQERLEGRVQTKRVRGPFWIRREPERNISERRRGAMILSFICPAAIVFYHSLSTGIYLTDHFLGQKLIAQTSETPPFFLFFSGQILQWRFPTVTYSIESFLTAWSKS